MSVNDKKNYEFYSNSKLLENPFISIIVPIYGAGETIRRSIMSVLNQTFTDIELICVDDKSSDDSVHVVKEFIKTDKRVRLICHKKNMGTLKARSTGVLAAKGQYILFLDQDDELEIFACEELYHVASQNKADIYGFGVTVICPDEETGRRQQGIFKTYGGYFYGIDIMKKSVTERVLSFMLWDKMYASKPCKKAHELIGDYFVDFEQSPLGEDVLAFIATAYFSDVFFGIEKPLYRYHYGYGFMGHTSLTLKGYERLCMSAITVEKCRELFDKLGESENYAEIIDSFSKRKINLCKFTLFDRIADEDKKEALQIMKRYWSCSDMIRRFGSTDDAVLMKRWEIPFELLPEGSRIVLYGAGDVGQYYYSQLADSKIYEIVLWVDMNHSAIKEPSVNVNAPCEIAKIEFDMVLIAVSDEATASSITKFLTESLNVPKNRIIWQDPFLVD